MLEEDSGIEEIEAKATAILGSEADDSEKIRQLHELGYSNAQLYKEFGFSRSLVYQVCPVKPEKKVSREEKHEDNDFRLPAILKAGQGQEVLTPEGILQTYLFEDGDAGQQLFKGFMLYRAAQLAVMSDVEIMKGQAEAQARMIKPIMDMMQETRKEQDAAAERAKASSVEVAERAAHQTALEVANRLEQMVPKAEKGASIADRVLGPAADMMGQMMGNMFKMFMPGQGQGQSPTPSGWEREKEER